jgi:hypothetical protein
MARARRKRILWTKADLKTLKTRSGKTSATELARQLRRSVTAVRIKASELRLSLKLRRRR